jgi:hypothetical protein
MISHFHFNFLFFFFFQNSFSTFEFNPVLRFISHFSKFKMILTSISFSLTLISTIFLLVRFASGEHRFLVMAAAAGYKDPDIFRVFLVSLREIAKYNGDIALFVDDYNKWSDEIVELLKRFNVKFVKFESTDHISRHGSRISRYLTNVRACGDEYRACFAVDFRDLFFQSDPFAAIEKHLPVGVDLMLTAEDPAHLLSRGRYNPRWIASCWGRPFLRSVSREVTLCSGTILGTPRGFRQLRDSMVAELSVTMNRPLCTARDQGHLNYLFYSGRLNESMVIRVEERGYGLVNTHAREVATLQDREGAVCNVDGSLSPVVHQFDRSEKLTSYFRDKVSRETGGAK